MNRLKPAQATRLLKRLSGVFKPLAIAVNCATGGVRDPDNLWRQLKQRAICRFYTEQIRFSIAWRQTFARVKRQRRQLPAQLDYFVFKGR